MRFRSLLAAAATRAACSGVSDLTVKVEVVVPMLTKTLSTAMVTLFCVCLASQAENTLNGSITIWMYPADLHRKKK